MKSVSTECRSVVNPSCSPVVRHRSAQNLSCTILQISPRRGIRPLKTRLIPVLILGLISSFALAQPRQHPEIVAYVFPQNVRLQPGQIDPDAITRVNYAFANVQDGEIVTGFSYDGENLPLLVGLRKSHPHLKVLVSVGGWLWSGQFSQLALTTDTRRKFIRSALAFVQRYQLDGLDLDWEYPGMPGAGNVFRKEDKENFTSLLRELRQAFDAESQRTRRKLYLTIAAGASDQFLEHTQMSIIQQYLDSVNLMAYDYYEPGSGPITGHHSPLFENPADPNKVSASRSIKAFERAGVPARKIILGVPFYGHVWGQVPNRNHGLYQPGKAVPNGWASFVSIESTMLNHGFIRYWDFTSEAPYLFNPEQGIFVSFEDTESIQVKCRYIQNHKLGGIMFWSYADDSDGKLLKAIDETLMSHSN